MARRAGRRRTEPRGVVTLYHVSPMKNDTMIERIGLDPRQSLGAQRVVWGCTASKIPWALAHIASHHKVDWRTLTVWRMVVPRYGLQRRRAGVWIDIRGECIPVERVSWPDETGIPCRVHPDHKDH